MSHEKSATVKVGNRWFNLRTVMRGKTIGERGAVKAFREGKLKPLGASEGFANMKEAVSAAKARSKRTNTRPPRTVAGRKVRKGVGQK